MEKQPAPNDETSKVVFLPITTFYSRGLSATYRTASQSKCDLLGNVPLMIGLESRAIRYDAEHSAADLTFQHCGETCRDPAQAHNHTFQTPFQRCPFKRCVTRRSRTCFTGGPVTWKTNSSLFKLCPGPSQKVPVGTQPFHKQASRKRPLTTQDKQPTTKGKPQPKPQPRQRKAI